MPATLITFPKAQRNEELARWSLSEEKQKQCCFCFGRWRAVRAELVMLQSFSAVGKESSSWHHNQKQRGLRDLTFSCFSVSCKWTTAPRMRGFACVTPQKQYKRNCRNTAPGRFFLCRAEAEDKISGSCCPFNSLFRYNMRRQEEQGRQDHDQGLSSERHSSDQDISEEGKLQELLNNDQKIEELHRSVERLREFVAGLPERGTPSLPPSVEQYCDKMSQYRVKEGSSVVELAERRVNKMLRNRKIKRNWNNEDITLLVWLVSKRIQLLALPHFSDLGKNDWEFISSLIAGSTWQKCKFKWLSLKKVKLVTHKWSKMESRLLAQAIGQEDKINWKLVSEKLYEKNMAKNKVFRTAKQCREHWNCFLNPNIHKGPWSIQEDRKLLEYVLELEGSKKWSEIAKFMEGRTENALKNRFNLLVNSQRKISGHLTEKRLLKICLNRLMLEEGQQERLEMQSPIAQPLAEEGQELVEFAEAEEFQNRGPIVPTVSEQNTFNSSIGFRPSYQSMLNYLNGGVLSAPQMMGQNAVYIGFLFPGQYL